MSDITAAIEERIKQIPFAAEMPDVLAETVLPRLNRQELFLELRPRARLAAELSVKNASASLDRKRT